jgi:hypothetical protein
MTFRLKPLSLTLLLGLTACLWRTPGPPTPTQPPEATPTRAATPAATHVATAASTATPAPTAMPPPPNKLGVHLLLDDGRNAWPVALWQEHLRYARQAAGAGGYVVQLVRLDDLHPARWQVFFDLCAELELRPILRLATTFDRRAGYWNTPPADADGGYATVAQQYAAFVAAVRWLPGPRYVIVGNEPNHGDEWGGRADPAAYARFLLEVSAALKQADPQVKVLNAPLDHFSPHTNGQPFINGFTYIDAETFMDEMRAAQPGVFAAVDVWGSHPYPLGPFSEGPWAQTFQIDLLNGARNPARLEPPAGLFNRGINAYEWELHKLESYGIRGLEVMITETGWRHAESVDANARDAGPNWPGVHVVADYVDLALKGNGGRYPQWPEAGWTPWLHDPRVIAVVFFAFNGLPAEWGHTNWLQLDSEGNVLGAYPMFEALTDAPPPLPPP